MHCLIVATIAGGSGDIAWLSNVLCCLSRRRIVASVAVVAQSGRTGGDVLEATRAELAATPTARSAVAALCAGERLSGRESDGVAITHGWQRVVGAGVAATPGEAPFLTAAFVLQGPLHLFCDAADALAAVALAPADAARCVLITLREFGQGFFCSPPRPLAIDVSLGLGEGEMGIFSALEAAAVLGVDAGGLTSPVTGRAEWAEMAIQWGLHRGSSSGGSSSGASSADVSATSALVVGYFREASHASVLGAGAATVAMLSFFSSMILPSSVCAASASASTSSQLLGASDDGAFSLNGVVNALFPCADAAYMVSFREGLARHPAVQSCEMEAAAADDAAVSGQSLEGRSGCLKGTAEAAASAVAAVADLSSSALRSESAAAATLPLYPVTSFRVCFRRGPVPVSGGAGIKEDGGTVSVIVRCFDLWRLSLSRSAFRHALECRAAFAVVSGDASLNEAVVASALVAPPEATTSTPTSASSEEDDIRMGGLPYWYSACGHKIFTGAALNAAAGIVAPKKARSAGAGSAAGAVEGGKFEVGLSDVSASTAGDMEGREKRSLAVNVAIVRTLWAFLGSVCDAARGRGPRGAGADETLMAAWTQLLSAIAAERQAGAVVESAASSSKTLLHHTIASGRGTQWHYVRRAFAAFSVALLQQHDAERMLAKILDGVLAS